MAAGWAFKHLSDCEAEVLCTCASLISATDGSAQQATRGQDSNHTNTTKLPYSPHELYQIALGHYPLHGESMCAISNLALNRIPGHTETQPDSHLGLDSNPRDPLKILSGEDPHSIFYDKYLDAIVNPSPPKGSYDSKNDSKLIIAEAYEMAIREYWY